MLKISRILEMVVVLELCVLLVSSVCVFVSDGCIVGVRYPRSGHLEGVTLRFCEMSSQSLIYGGPLYEC